MTVIKSAEQERAGYSLGVINAYKIKDSAWQQSYSSYVKSLPATILNCGLGQAMAFLLAKAGGNMGSPHGQLYCDLEKWLCRDGGVFSPQDNLMEALTANEMKKYLVAQAEALSLLVWLKKLATAFLRKAEAGGDD